MYICLISCCVYLFTSFSIFLFIYCCFPIWEYYKDEEKDCEGEYVEAEISFDQGEMDEYYRKFTNLMQAKLHKKYDLRSRKRSRV